MHLPPSRVLIVTEVVLAPVFVSCQETEFSVVTEKV